MRCCLITKPFQGGGVAEGAHHRSLKHLLVLSVLAPPITVFPLSLLLERVSVFHRVLTYEVEDSNGATNVKNSILQITIIPVNDPPFLFFVISDAFRSIPIPVPNGLTTEFFRYTEDDRPLNFGESIYLTDFDSKISMAVLVLESK